MTCPSELELARAITSAGGSAADPAASPEGDPDGHQLTAHLAACIACRTTWDRTRAMIDLARELPVALPSQPRREEVRTAVLAAAASVTRRPSRPAWLAPLLAGAAAAAAIAYLAAPRASSSSSSSPVPPETAITTALVPARHGHGVVRPHPGARYVLSPTGPDESVQLTDGTIDLEVEPLAAGERFRVVVGRAEIEVRGTAFTVTASAEHLTSVAVARGRVDVKPETGAPAVLVAGQSWHVALAIAAEPASPTVAPPTAAIAPPTAAIAPLQSRTAPAPHHVAVPGTVPPRAAAPVNSRAAPRTAVLGTAIVPVRIAEPQAAAGTTSSSARPEPAAARNPEEQSYDQAWEALRANDFGRAASGFARVLLLAPDSALVEDASYWRAVALARARRSAEAMAAFSDFLDSHARSSRAGEASAMLGWILVDARAYDEAARRFRTAAGDANPAVRRSAQAGLDALARSKR